MKKNFFPILKALILELLITLGLCVIILFGIYYAIGNQSVFTNLSILHYGQGWESFWLFLFFGADVGFFMVVMTLLTELALLLLRTALLILLNTMSQNQDNRGERAKNIIRKLSLLTLLKALGIKSWKKGMIVYFLVMFFILGTGWVGKTILSSSESLVFRSHELINLESVEESIDMTSAISSQEPVDIVITTNVGSVHLYTMTNQTEADLNYRYDVEGQLSHYSATFEGGILTVSFNTEETAYTQYIDPVLPTLEIYLPSNIVVGNLTVNIAVYGYLTTEFLDFEKMEVSATASEISIKAANLHVGDLIVNAGSSKLNMELFEADSVSLYLDSSYATGAFRTIDQALELECWNSDLFLSNTKSGSLLVETHMSTIEFRELYAPEIQISTEKTHFLFFNSDADYAYTSFERTPIGDENVFSFKGLPVE